MTELRNFLTLLRAVDYVEGAAAMRAEIQAAMDDGHTAAARQSSWTQQQQRSPLAPFAQVRRVRDRPAVSTGVRSSRSIRLTVQPLRLPAIPRPAQPYHQPQQLPAMPRPAQPQHQPHPLPVVPRPTQQMHQPQRLPLEHRPPRAPHQPQQLPAVQRPPRPPRPVDNVTASQRRSVHNASPMSHLDKGKGKLQEELSKRTHAEQLLYDNRNKKAMHASNIASSSNSEKLQSRSQRSYTLDCPQLSEKWISEEWLARVMSILPLKDLSVCSCLNKYYFTKMLQTQFQLSSPVVETMAAKSPIFFPNYLGRPAVGSWQGLIFNLGSKEWQEGPDMSWLPPHVKVPLRSCAGVICYTTPRLGEYFMCSPLSKKFMVLPRDDTFHGVVHEMIEVPPLQNNPDWRKQSSTYFQLIVMGLSNWHKRKLALEAGRRPEGLYTNVLQIYDSRFKGWSPPVDVPATKDFPVMVFPNRKVNLVVQHTTVPAAVSACCNGVLYMISFVSGVCVAYDIRSRSMKTLLRRRIWRELELGRALPHLVASEDRVFLVDNLTRFKISIYELPGPEQIGQLQDVIEPTLVGTLWHDTEIEEFLPVNQSNNEHTFNCFYQSGRIFIMSDSGMQAVFYNLKDRKWTWLPSYPLLDDYFVERVVGLPFTPRLGIRF